MTLAAYSDSNRYLDGTKLSFLSASDPNYVAASTFADSIVRSALVNLFPTHANTWQVGGTDPTPALPLEIAAMLAASQYYSKKYSEESLDPNSYSSRLYQQAIDLLAGLAIGTYTLSDVSYISTVDLVATDFWPNNTTVVTEDKPQVGLNVGDPDRKFSMSRTF